MLVEDVQPSSAVDRSGFKKFCPSVLRRHELHPMKHSVKSVFIALSAMRVRHATAASVHRLSGSTPYVAEGQ